MKRAAVVCIAALGACDDPVRGTPDAAPAPSVVDAAPPRQEGCARAGLLQGVEADPACSLASAPESVTREARKRILLGLEIEPQEVFAGATAILRITVSNTSAREVLVALDAYTRPPGPRTDWSRIMGVPPPAEGAPAPGAPQLLFSVTTLDEYEHAVDAVPTVAGSGTPPTSKIIGVRVRPGEKVVQSVPWWALRIPAPPPVVIDDAGFRYVPKTVPVPLRPGDYTVAVEIPLHGIAAAERTVSGRVHVVKSPTPRVAN